MASKEDRWPENVPGKYYVDDQCIDCDLCREIAEMCFKRESSGGYSYVSKQPVNQNEEDLCREALESCPVNAIGDNGD